MLTRIQDAHMEQFLENINHTNLSARTWFHSAILFNPNPPQILGVQTETQETFAPLAEVESLFHKKPLHMRSSASTQSLGRIKIVAQR